MIIASRRRGAGHDLKDRAVVPFRLFLLGADPNQLVQIHEQIGDCTDFRQLHK